MAIRNFAHTADFHSYFKTKILTSHSSLNKLLVPWGTRTTRFYCIVVFQFWNNSVPKYIFKEKMSWLSNVSSVLEHLTTACLDHKVLVETKGHWISVPRAVAQSTHSPKFVVDAHVFFTFLLLLILEKPTAKKGIDSSKLKRKVV